MRKKGFAFFLFASLLFLSRAHSQQTFRAGIQAGINGSQVHGDSYSGFNKAGVVGGIFVCTDPTKRFYAQMEMQYSSKGSRKNPNPDKGDYTSFRLAMNYAEVPFLLRMNSRNVYFEIGQTFGFLVNVREWDSNGEIHPAGFRKWETAFIFGAGINLNPHFSVDLRYTNSVAPVLKFQVPLYYPNFFMNLFNKGMYHNVLGLTLAYRFGDSGTSQ
ncbi:MAG TPA: porin family protein [Bacteroidia bacterium]|nr:porin family protein [Bacteroidia bacterium]